MHNVSFLSHINTIRSLVENEKTSLESFKMIKEPKTYVIAMFMKKTKKLRQSLNRN